MKLTKEHLYKLIQEVLDSTVQEIEEFCERINIIAKKYNYLVLKKWSNEIKSLNNQFDIHGVLEKVEEINLIVSILEEEKKAS